MTAGAGDPKGAIFCLNLTVPAEGLSIVQADGRSRN